MTTYSHSSRFFHVVTPNRIALTVLVGAVLFGCKPSDKESSAAHRVIAAPVDLGLVGAPSGTTDIQLAAKPATPPSPPLRLFVWVQGRDVRIGRQPEKGGLDVLESFRFDEKSQRAEEPGGAVVTTDSTPVPLLFNPVNSILTDSGGGMSARYSNLILDFSAAKYPEEDFFLGIELATRGVNLSDIELSVARAKELFISPDYVVFPDQIRTVQADGPFVQLAFSQGKASKSVSVPAGSNLVLTRNGTVVTKTSFPEIGEYAIGLKRVRNSNDVVAWRLEDQAGKCSHRSTLAFPVAAAVPDIVRYVVRVGEHPVPAGK